MQDLQNSLSYNRMLFMQGKDLNIKTMIEKKLMTSTLLEIGLVRRKIGFSVKVLEKKFLITLSRPGLSNLFSRRAIFIFRS